MIALGGLSIQDDDIMPEKIPSLLTKQELAYGYLRDRIMSGELAPGARIVIDGVAEDLQMSSIPVREALSHLAREGFVRVRPHVGATVAEIPPRAIAEIFALLEATELAGARLGLSAVDESLLAAMGDLCRRMEDTSDIRRWSRLNRAFHEALPRHAGLERIVGTMVRVGEDWQRLCNVNHEAASCQDIRVSNAEHRTFVDLLSAKDFHPVERWIRDHNRLALGRHSKDGC